MRNSRLPVGDEQHRLYLATAEHSLSTRELHLRVEALLAPHARRTPTVSKSVVPLDDGARVVVYPSKYVLRVPRRPSDPIDLARLADALDRIAPQLRHRAAD
mgnify:CR=1 FL=1